jgi:hypothetical protein
MSSATHELLAFREEMMHTHLFVATALGILSFTRAGGSWNQAGGALTQQYITSIAAQGNELLAGTRDGIYRWSSTLLPLTRFWRRLEAGYTTQPMGEKAGTTSTKPTAGLCRPTRCVPAT